MKSSTLGILVAATVVVAGGAGFALYQRQQATAVAAEGGPLLPGFLAKVNSATSLAVIGPKQSFTVAKGAGETWSVVEKDGYPAKGDVVKKAIVGMAELKIVESRTANPEMYERLGVGEPGKDPEAVSLTLKDAAGTVLGAVILGKTKTYESGGKNGEYYVRVPGQKESWVGSARLQAPGDALRWIDNNLSRLSRERIASVTITHAGEPPVKVVPEADKPGEFRLLGIPAGQKLKSSSDPNSTAGGLDYLAFDDVKKADKIDFTKAPATAVYSTADGLDVTVTMVTMDGKTWARFAVAFDAARAAAFKPAATKGEDGKDKEPAAFDAKKVETEAAELAKKVDGWAFQLSEGNAKPLTRKMADLLESETKDDEKKAN